MVSVVLATENQNKVREFSEILNNLTLLSLKEIGFSEKLPEEGKISYQENAANKALFVGRKINQLVIGDDSGFEVDALKGAPGIESARFGNTSDSKTQRKLILESVRKTNGPRSARFVCYLALYIPKTKSVRISFGEVRGKVANEETGVKGFGYDSIFIPDGYSKTFSEMDASEKNKISHRAFAIAELQKILFSL